MARVDPLTPARPADPLPTFDRYLRSWDLVPDGAPIVTRASRLLPVLRDGAPAMLKIALDEEEKPPGEVLAWWDGKGAARALATAGDAVLLERAIGDRSLTALVRTGQDDNATHILCDVIAAACCTGFSPGPGCRQRDSSATAKAPPSISRSPPSP